MDQGVIENDILKLSEGIKVRMSLGVVCQPPDEFSNHKKSSSFYNNDEYISSKDLLKNTNSTKEKHLYGNYIII